jgi:hypothetical protein
VGGDLYDYIPVEEAGSSSNGKERWAVTLGDVAGKGMPAALVMAGICPEVRHLVRAGVPAMDVLSQVNRHVYDNGVAGRFVTRLDGRHVTPYEPEPLSDLSRIRLVDYELVFHQPFSVPLKWPEIVQREGDDDRFRILKILKSFAAVAIFCFGRKCE